MWTAFAGLFRLRVFKNVTQEFGVHLLHGDVVDFLEILNIPQFKTVKGETIEAIAFWIDIHGAVIGTPEV